MRLEEEPGVNGQAIDWWTWVLAVLGVVGVVVVGVVSGGR